MSRSEDQTQESIVTTKTGIRRVKRKPKRGLPERLRMAFEPQLLCAKSIKDARQYFKLRQEDLANLLEVKQQRISEWEAGVHRISPKMAIRLSNVFKMEWEKLWQ